MSVDYSNYASQFSETRTNKKWGFVERFLLNENPTKLLDVGCGNGRNMNKYESVSVGIEPCKGLSDIANANGYSVRNTCIDEYEFDEKFSTILCISVIQHILSREARLNCIRKMLNGLEVGGALLINHWTPKKRITGTRTVANIPFINNDGECYERHYYIYGDGEFLEDLKECMGGDSNFIVESETHSYENMCHIVRKMN
jgi:SAM-dependent methyltransferase